MTFADEARRAARAQFARLGEAATAVQPGGGSPLTCTVIVDRDVELEPNPSASYYAARITTVSVMTEQVPSVSTNWKVTLTASGQMWTLDQRMAIGDPTEIVKTFSAKPQ